MAESFKSLLLRYLEQKFPLLFSPRHRERKNSEEHGIAITEVLQKADRPIMVDDNLSSPLNQRKVFHAVNSFLVPFPPDSKHLNPENCRTLCDKIEGELMREKQAGFLTAGL